MKRRIGWLNTIRTAAILLVVLNHAVETFFNGAPNSMVGVGKWFAVIMFSLGRLGVPLFLFLSGYLLLDRTYESEKDVFNLYKKKLLPLFVSWEIWMLLYQAFSAIYYDEAISVKEVIEKALFVKPVGMPHAWYMYMLLGMYVSFPLISILLKNCSWKTLIIPIGFTATWSMVLPFVNDILSLCNQTTYSGQLTLWINGSSYGIFLIMGYFFKKYPNFTLKAWQDLLGFAISFGLTVVWHVIKYDAGFNYRVWYTFILMPITAFFFFDMLRKIRLNRFFGYLATRISICSFGIYLIHVPIQRVLRRTLFVGGFPRPYLVLGLFVLNFIISWLVVEILSRIKWVGKLLFLISRPQRNYAEITTKKYKEV